MRHLRASCLIGLALASAVVTAQQTAPTHTPPQTPSPATEPLSPLSTPPAQMPLPMTPSGALDLTRPLTCDDLPQIQPVLTRARTRLDDWPALARYRAANAALVAPRPPLSRVVFMGDSITDAWDDPKFSRYFAGHTNYVNRGISGQTTPQMLLRMRQDVINLAPRVVVILAGTNDIAGNTGPMTIEETFDHLTSMAELARASNIRVVLSTVMPTSNYHFKPDPRGPQTTRRPLEKIVRINTWIKAYAANEGHTVLDYYTAMVDDKGMLKAELSEDDLHPNEIGYRLMEPLAEAALKQALAAKR